ncbi:MAG TPA: lamin tail domain-containing protein, partial [Kofleriaceae bacterium]
YAIKMAMFPSGSAVTIHNALVTAAGTNGFYVQTKTGDAGYMGSDYSGMFVFTGAGSPNLAMAAIGTRVSVSGTVDAFQGETELDNLTSVTIDSATVEALPALVTATYAEVKTGGTRSAALEGVLTQLTAASVTAFNATYGESTLTAPDANTLIMDDFLDTGLAPAIGTNYASIAGVYAIRNSVGTILPRGASDLVIGAPGLASIGPTMTYARVGTTNNTDTFPSALTVTLTAPAQGATTVMLMSGATANLTVPATVVVPSGATTVTVPVTAVAANAQPVVVTAMLGTDMKSSNVRVLAANDAPTTVAISPPSASVAAGGTVTFTVTLDLPADTAKTVNLSVAPASGTLPASVSIATNAISQTFTYTNTAASGTATVTATFGASTATATVTVATGANHLVINEVDYDQVGADAAEFVEIYNPTGAPIDLTGKALLLVNGSNSAVYGTINLASAGSLAGGQYLVVTTAVAVPVGALKVDPNWHTSGGDVQNGAPDGLALVDTSSHTVIDALSYEGPITGAILGTGFPASTSLVEGTVLPDTVADSNTGPGSLCRSPNGTDTDNAATDWAFCATSTPGVANTL